MRITPINLQSTLWMIINHIITPAQMLWLFTAWINYQDRIYHTASWKWFQDYLKALCGTVGNIKVELIAVGHMTVCNMKGVLHYVKPKWI